MSFQIGDIVRYGGGSSALVKLVSEHAGGYHGTHCLGGLRFVSESYPCTMFKATPEDIDTYHQLRERTLTQQGRPLEPR